MRDVRDLHCAVLAAENGLIVVFKVYHDGSPVVTVAAYLARPKQWEVFTKEWVRAIQPAKIYHAADAANCRGEFKGWTPQQVAEMAKRALPIIPKHTEMAVANGIHMGDYEAALKNKPQLRKLLGEPYGACLQWTLSTLLRPKAELGNREQIAFFHEQNNFAAEAFRTYQYTIEKWGMGARTSFTFGSKEKYVPLQAADIYAYEANKRLRDTSRSRPNRKALDALVPNPRKAVLGYYNHENMGELVARLEKAVTMPPSAMASWADGVEQQHIDAPWRRDS